MHIKNCILDPKEWKLLLRLSKFCERKQQEHLQFCNSSKSSKLFPIYFYYMHL